MSDLIRFGISMEKDLLSRLDQEIVKRGYPNRSEAIRDLIRNQLVEIAWSRDKKKSQARLRSYTIITLKA
jgi:CopG family transcriptional regulator, nickel-responsive regulator